MLLFLYVGADFSLIGLTEYIAVAAMPLRILPLFCIRVWDYPNSKTDTARQGPNLAVFRECGHTPYACYISVLSAVLPMPLLYLWRYRTTEMSAGIKNHKENRQYFLILDGQLLIIGKPQE